MTPKGMNVERNIGISGETLTPWCVCGWQGRTVKWTPANRAGIVERSLQAHAKRCTKRSA